MTGELTNQGDADIGQSSIHVTKGDFPIVGEFDQPALTAGKTISFNVTVEINASPAEKQASLSVDAVPKHSVEEYSTKNNHAVAHVKLHN